MFHLAIHGRSVFSSAIVARFLKGLIRFHPPVQESVPLWDLNVVMEVLMGCPLKPLASCPFLLFCQKTVFLMAIISARRVCELQALMAEHLCTQFFNDNSL